MSPAEYYPRLKFINLADISENQNRGEREEQERATDSVAAVDNQSIRTVISVPGRTGLFRIQAAEWE